MPCHLEKNWKWNTRSKRFGHTSMEFSKDTTAFPAQRLRECAALCSVSVDVLHPLSNGPRIFCVALMSSKFMNKRRSEWNETRFFLDTDFNHSHDDKRYWYPFIWFWWAIRRVWTIASQSWLMNRSSTSMVIYLSRSRIYRVCALAEKVSH